MSSLRPETRRADDSEPCLSGGSAYLAIYNAVRGQEGLISGRLHNSVGEHCAIGSYFSLPKHVCLPMNLIDEVAAVNDSMPSFSKKQRRTMMLRWLRWKLGTIGMPGFKAAANQQQPPTR